MMPKSKQVVIDKSAFDGIRTDALCGFARCHVLLVSDTLLYECATSDERRKKGLDRYEKLVRDGAHWCSMSTEYIEWEGKNSRPYPRLLANAQKTEWIRAQTENLDVMLDSQITNKSRDSHWAMPRRMFLEMSRQLHERVCSELPHVASEIRDLPDCKFARFQTWLNGIDTYSDIHELALQWLPSRWIGNTAQFCTSREWMAWQHLRLSLAVQRDYVYLRQKGGDPGNRLAEHDDRDVEYVLLLSRADGIITRDKKLVEPLTRAAFPEKDVFSSLEEVPESYRCDWTNP